MLTLSQGRLFGATYESLLFGINSILYLMLIVLALRTKNVIRLRQPRLLVVTVIYCLCAGHLALVLRGLQLAFFESESSAKFYNDHTQPVDLGQKGTYALATLLGDGLLTHRLYVIFGRNWKAAVLPGATVVATTVIWIILIDMYRTSPPGTTLFSKTLAPLVPTAFALSFLANVMITLMIIIRIKLVLRRVQSTDDTGRFYKRFLAITIESGSIYPIALLITGLLYLLKDPGLEILSGSNIQLMGIVSNLLTLQLKLGMSIYDAVAGPATTNEKTLPLAFIPGNTDTDSMSHPTYSTSHHLGAPTESTISGTGNSQWRVKGFPRSEHEGHSTDRVDLQTDGKAHSYNQA